MFGENETDDMLGPVSMGGEAYCELKLKELVAASEAAEALPGLG